MQPSADIVRALREQGIRIDTSVFKHGSRTGLVRFDYQDAFSDLVPWPVDPTEICRADPQGELWEVPIYCENRPIWDFLSVARFYRVWQASGHPMPEGPREAAGSGSPGGRLGKLGALVRRHAWKMDFNQCSGRQLIGALQRIAARYGDSPHPLPVVLIGHSKLFTRHNEKDLAVFLGHVAGRAADCRFSTLAELDLAAMRKAFEHERAGGAVLRDPQGAESGTAQ